LDLRLAERGGFEPQIQFPVYTLSKRALSTTQPSLLEKRIRGYHKKKFFQVFFKKFSGKREKRKLLKESLKIKKRVEKKTCKCEERLYNLAIS
jgi:CRISPR/Cas system CMR subunit Cmr6 (Cas7 group RAMP superfamily)